jgi:predicted TIM-barrel fold metal-dependent hydrolase
MHVPRLIDDVAIRFPDVKIVMAHLGHPWDGECIVTIRKHPNVYADCYALHYRPFFSFTTPSDTAHADANREVFEE